MSGFCVFVIIEVAFVQFAEINAPPHLTILINKTEYRMAILQYAGKFDEYREVAGPDKRRGILDEIPIPRTRRSPSKNPPPPDYDKD